MAPSDRRIASEVSKYGGWMKPATIGLNAPYTRQHVANRCAVLAEHGILERHPDLAAYKMTELGELFVSGELDASDLEDVAEE